MLTHSRLSFLRRRGPSLPNNYVSAYVVHDPCPTLPMRKLEKLQYPTLKHGPWGAMIHIITHLIVGAIIFMAIATAALGLGLFVKKIEGWGAAPFVIWVLTAVEYFLVVADALLFVYVVGKSIWKVGKDMEL